MIAVLGAGVHGKQIAEFYDAELFDDHKDGYKPTKVGGYLYPYVVGAAMPGVRRQIVNNLELEGEAWEKGIVVFPGVRIGRDVTIGDHTHILFNAVVSHGCRVGQFVTVSSGVVLAGEVTVGDDVFIGANATVIHGGIDIGRGATVGAGAVVLHDVPAGATVVGSPARLVS